MTATVVLVSPPCATTAAWSRVVPLLDDEGIPTMAVQLPSCLPESALDDVGCLRSALDACDGPAVLVGHSNGGLILTEVGAHPAVAHLVYMDAVMWDVGEPTRLTGAIIEEFAACVRVGRQAAAFDVDTLARYLVGRGWPEDDTREFVAAFRPQRHAASLLALTTAAWRRVPSTFVAPSDSEMKRLHDRFAPRASEVVELEGDHFPNWRRPQEVAEVLARIAASR